MLHFVCDHVVVSLQKYQMYGSDVAMSMTADATCRGLRSSVDGPLIMELYKGRTEIKLVRFLS